MIDYRSDTVTKPTREMLQAMFEAKVGDDVFEDDPTVNKLQEKAALMFGMEAALFCPSGTMTNQIAIKLHTRPGDEVICDRLSHIYNYEGGGIAYNSLASVRLLDGDRGRFTSEQILENINADNVHFPRTSLVAIENTVNKGGGCFYTLQDIGTIKKVCIEHSLALHLDGARIFNALVETGESPVEYGKQFHTISVCLSKGLGAPVGSLLLGSKEKIKEAKRVRKVLGGGWRQAGYLAAAGIYALDHHIGRLKEDHKKAEILASCLMETGKTEEIYPTDTNIVIFRLKSDEMVNSLMKHLEGYKIKASPFGRNMIRLVTHLDITDEMVDTTMKAFKSWKI